MFRLVLFVFALMTSWLFETDPAQSTETPATSPAEPSESGRTFVQKDVDKIIAAEKRSASESAAKARDAKLLQDSGAASIEELMAGYKGFKTVEEETQSETEKARNEVERVKAEKAAVEEEREDAFVQLAEMKQDAAVRVALQAAGVHPDYLDIAAEYAGHQYADMMDIDDAGKVTGAEKVAEVTKQRSAVWFGALHTTTLNTPAGTSPFRKGAARSYGDKKYGTQNNS